MGIIDANNLKLQLENVQSAFPPCKLHKQKSCNGIYQVYLVYSIYQENTRYIPEGDPLLASLVVHTRLAASYYREFLMILSVWPQRASPC